MLKNSKRQSTIIVASLCLMWAPLAHATDGVIEINQASAEAGGITPGDAPGLPVEIFQAGSYRLTGNLSDKSGASSSMVFISAGAVTFDLGGFEISGDGSTGVGILAETIDVTVRNGRVRDVSGLGIDLGSRGRVEDVTVRDAGGGGIECAADCKLRGLMLQGNGGVSVECGLRCELLDSTVFTLATGAVTAGSDSLIRGNLANGGTGSISVMIVESGSIVAHNTIRDGNVGITATGPVSVTGNVITGTAGTGIVVTGMGTIEGNAVEGAPGGFGIVAGAGSLVRGNSIRGAGSWGLVGAGGGGWVGYSDNVFTNNNGGDASTQVGPSAFDLGGNLCGDPIACP